MRNADAIKKQVIKVVNPRDSACCLVCWVEGRGPRRGVTNPFTPA